MSLSVDGVWKAGAWATTVWADGVWREGVAAVIAGELQAEINVYPALAGRTRIVPSIACDTKINGEN